MAKKRKTRSQKISSDLRQKDLSSKASPEHSLPLTSAPTTSNDLPIPSTNSRHAVSSEYKFVSHDLIKTSSITGAIIIAELVLFFLVK